MSASLKAKISYFERFTLDNKRHFALISVDEHQRYDLYWSFGQDDGCSWALESSVWNDEAYDEVSMSLTTEDLLPTLNDMDICLEDFESRMDAHLLFVAAHMMESLKEIDSLYDSATVDRVAKNLSIIGDRITSHLSYPAPSASEASEISGAETQHPLSRREPVMAEVSLEEGHQVASPSPEEGFDFSTLELAMSMSQYIKERRRSVRSI